MRLAQMAVMGCGLLTIVLVRGVVGQEYGPADRGEPGDRMIQEYLAREAERIEQTFIPELGSREQWEERRRQYQEEYRDMLGLSPMPAKTPLEAAVTSVLFRDDYLVEKLHFQSRPRLYVTGNVYRPRKQKAGERLPAVLYVCGHSDQGRNGNKTAYQSHGIWFARHGYICLMVDTLQLGEIRAIHHGTYRENRWWWHSRGYTPAGVECWNGIRAIDYLVGRPEVDPQRIAVTGISGGGAATLWIAAADERVSVAVPVSGMADLSSYVGNRVINGHCDCMFLYNTYQWPWARIAALVAPRAMMLTNSDHDAIFPMDANERLSNRLERVYSLYGKSDDFEAMVSIGDHAYRQDLRQAAYRFINSHLKDDPRVVMDSEVDLVTGSGEKRQYPIAPELLRAFASESDLPKDELNTTIDRHFVPMAEVEPPQAGKYESWKAGLVAGLRRLTFRGWPERIAPAKLIQAVDGEGWRLETEPGIEVRLQEVAALKPTEKVSRALLIVQTSATSDTALEFARRVRQAGDAVYFCQPRGVGPTRWTRKNPPNYVERSHVLLGRTVDGGRVWDVAATARFVRAKQGGQVPVHVVGEEGAGVLAAYAAIWEPEIEGVILRSPPMTHMDDRAPSLLNVLRVCDVPETLGMLAPRTVVVHGVPRQRLHKVAAAFEAAASRERLVVVEP